MQNYPPNQSPSGQQWPAQPATQSQVPTAMSNSQYAPPPPQQYAPPPMQAMPPYKPAPKKKAPWLWIIACFVCLMLGYGVGKAGAADTPTTQAPTTQATQPSSAATQAPTTAAQPTQKPTQAPKWTTTHTFKGNGSKKTEVFAVGDDWKINWTCDPASFQNIEYNVIITIDNSDGSFADSGVNSTCKKASASGSTEIHSSGNVYLDIVSEGDWTIQIQEMK